ncbi:MAG: helix-turn-helix domain-containing protein [Bacteroidetes bacterium]|nr:helix-turn-helix domain-containing protein [Bacteroidota bacterium]
MITGKAIRQTRKKQNLTQEELGRMVGVQKAQISRLENSAGNVTIDTLIRVFRALEARVMFRIELNELRIGVEA